MNPAVNKTLNKMAKLVPAKPTLTLKALQKPFAKPKQEQWSDDSSAYEAKRAKAREESVTNPTNWEKLEGAREEYKARKASPVMRAGRKIIKF